MTEVPEEVEEAIVVSETPTPKPANFLRNKKRKKSGCECDEDQPHNNFVLPASKGLIKGTFCSVCYGIISWELEKPEPAEPKLELKEKKVKDGKVGKVDKVDKPAKKFIQSYEILQLMPIEASPDKIKLICTNGNIPFNVEMQSTIEKVQAGLANPSNIIGKYVELEFELTTGQGVPVNSIVKSFKAKP